MRAALQIPLFQSQLKYSCQLFQKDEYLVTGYHFLIFARYLSWLLSLLKLLQLGLNCYYFHIIHLVHFSNYTFFMNNQVAKGLMLKML